MSELHPTVIFDGRCNLCESAVAFIVRRDKAALFRFAPAQSRTGQALQKQHGLDALELQTLILIKDGRVHTRSDAAIEIARELDGPWKLLAVLRPVPSFLRDPVYAFVARNRYRWFGQKAACMVPSREMKARFLDQ